MRIILFTGKGGVGKTTLSAATAIHSAQLGHKTLIISTDVAHSLADVLGAELGGEAIELSVSNLSAAEIDTGEELERYWGEAKRRISQVLRAEGISPPIAGELAVIPGLDEVLALVRIKHLYDEGRYEVLIIDSAPTGAAMRLLAAPDLQRLYTRNLLGLSRGLARAIWPALRGIVKLPLGEQVIRERVGELFDQVDELRGLLTDAERTSVRVVLNPDYMALRETQRAYTYMNLFGLSVDALFVNRILPEEVEDPYFSHWKTSQALYRQEIKELFEPLPVYEVPLSRREIMGLSALEHLSRQTYGAADPVSRLSSELPLSFFMENGKHVLALRVSGVLSSHIDLEKEGDELRVRLGRFRRSLILPRYLAGLQPSWAQIEGDYLRVVFEETTPDEP